MSRATPLLELIADAIRAADTSYFNEDYLKQAKAVVLALRKAGYEVVPVSPSEAQVEHVSQNLPLGRLKQQELIRTLYTMMVESSRRFSG